MFCLRYIETLDEECRKMKAKNSRQSPKISIDNLASIEKLSKIECQQVWGGQGIIQDVIPRRIIFSVGVIQY